MPVLIIADVRTLYYCYSLVLLFTETTLGIGDI